MTTRIEQLEAQIALLMPVAEWAMRARAQTILINEASFNETHGGTSDESTKASLNSMLEDSLECLDEALAECAAAGIVE